MAEVGEVARKAEVKTLVLNHFVPTGSPVLDKEEIWLAGVGKNFKGSIIVGTDLTKIPLWFTSYEKVFITHNHSDHVADYGTLVWFVPSEFIV